jgi:hypothetical protein
MDSLGYDDQFPGITHTRNIYYTTTIRKLHNPSLQ